MAVMFKTIARGEPGLPREIIPNHQIPFMYYVYVLYSEKDVS